MNIGMRVSALAGVLTLAACGGDGGDGGVVTPTPLTVSGTAAKGAALAGATVDVKCNGGTGSATTAADGAYTITLAGGSLPCVLKARDTSVSPAVDYHSVASGTGTTAKANITPVTQLVVASLLGSDPAGFYANFNAASDASRLSASAVDAAKTAVATVMQSNGIAIPADAGDFVTGNLVAGAGGAGNAADTVLENLATKLVSNGSTLADFTSVVQNATTTEPKAATCAALRSGTYRVLVPGNAGGDGSGNTEKITVDAVTLKLTNADNTSDTLVPVSGSPCRFRSGQGDDVVVAQSGVIGVRTQDGYFGIVFPEQTIPLSDLAGDWNMLGYDHGNDTDPLTALSLTATITASGGVTIGSVCEEAKTCSTINQPRTLTAAAGGGFLLAATSGDSRLFAYRAVNGSMMIVALGGAGEIGVGVRAASAALPEAGRLREGWNVGTLQQRLVDGTYVPSAFEIGDFSNTVLTVDTAASSFTRRNVINLTTNPVVTRDETLTVNKVAGAARPGYLYRVPSATSTNSSGQLSRTTEAIFLAMPGLGMTAAAFPAPAWGTAAQTQFLLSLTKP